MPCTRVPQVLDILQTMLQAVDEKVVIPLPPINTSDFSEIVEYPNKVCACLCATSLLPPILPDQPAPTALALPPHIYLRYP